MKRTAISRKPSARKKAFDAEYAKLLPEVLARGCEFGAHVDDTVTCEGRLVGHHAKGRRVADANDYLICLCTKHHDFVHSHPQWARTNGLMLTRTV
jgi:hypothetical protein